VTRRRLLDTTTILLVHALFGTSMAAAQGLPPIEREFSNGSKLAFYGQINKGILQYDDGAATRTYGLIDNNNSGTRVGLVYNRSFGDGWTFENVNEFQYAPYSTSNVNILDKSPDDYGWSNSNIRKIDFILVNEAYGKFWVGQGSMATDGVAEIDLSGTDVVAYASVADSAAGQLLRLGGVPSEESLPGVQVGDVYTDYDGDRRVRVRYDTPLYSGFTFAASYGRNLLSDDADTREQNLWDAALRYENTFSETLEFGAGVGYYWQEDAAKIVAGSASVLHAPTGLNLTLSAGNQNVDDGTDGNYWYGKLGLLRQFVSWGDTAMSVDYYTGNDIYVDGDLGATSSTSDSWGIGLVQNVDRANTQLWLTWRDYDYSDDVNDWQSGQAVFGGARFTF
jgi:hypothetical protein